SLTVEFGSSDQTRKEMLEAGAVIAKDLAELTPGVARALTVIVNTGAPPSGGDAPTPDGTSHPPHVVTPAFSLVLTTILPATDLTLFSPDGVATAHFAPTRALGVAPMGSASVAPNLELTWTRDGAALNFPFVASARPYGAFPIGVWGPPQDDNN